MSPAVKQEGESEKSVQTASRTPKLSVPFGLGGGPPGLDTNGLDPELTETIQAIEKKLESRRAPN